MAMLGSEMCVINNHSRENGEAITRKSWSAKNSISRIYFCYSRILWRYVDAKMNYQGVGGFENTIEGKFGRNDFQLLITFCFV